MTASQIAIKAIHLEQLLSNKAKEKVALVYPSPRISYDYMQSPSSRKKFGNHRWNFIELLKVKLDNIPEPRCQTEDLKIFKTTVKYLLRKMEEVKPEINHKERERHQIFKKTPLEVFTTTLKDRSIHSISLDEIISLIEKFIETLRCKEEIETALGKTERSPQLTMGCYLCKENSHRSFNCTLSFEKRLEAAKKKGFCFNCLRGNHLVNNCQYSEKCSKCGKKHHTSLHEAFGTNEMKSEGVTMCTMVSNAQIYSVIENKENLVIENKENLVI